MSDMKNTPDRTSEYRADSLSLIGAVALGTGVMIGAGIFALTGQMAEMTGSLSLQEIIATRNDSLAAAARPALGEHAV
jgi:hypothetical protein